MTDDLVARLRDLLTAALSPERRATIAEAADEIERLRAENARLLQEVSDLDNRMLEYEIERLRAPPASGVTSHKKGPANMAGPGGVEG
jgi:hypothetical protein